MDKIPFSFGLYAILTNPLKGYEYMTQLFVDHKIAFIQLRMKQEPPETILKTAAVEFRRTLKLDEAEVRLGVPSSEKPAGNGNNHKEGIA